MKKLKVLLVWPQGFLPSYAIPLAYGLLKSNVDPNLCDIKILDCVLKNIPAKGDQLRTEILNFKPDVVGVSTWSPMFPEALAIVRNAKKYLPTVTTIMGGAHPSSYYSKVIQYPEVDFVFRGEACKSFASFCELIHQQVPLDDFKWTQVKGLVYRHQTNGNIQLNSQDIIDPLDSIEYPDYEAIDLKTYQAQGLRWNSPPVPNAPLWITRGCPYRCQFCAAPQLNGKTIRTHSVSYMVGLVRKLYDQGTRWFNIIDDNFTFHVNFAKDFCRSIIALNLKGIGFGTPNGIRMNRGDSELWSLMKKAGWKHLVVAPESGSQNTLKIMKKDLDLKIVPKVVKEIRKSGLKVQAFFIIGYPGETPSDVQQTQDLILKCKFNFFFLANFHPLPGTPVFDSLVSGDKISANLLPHNFSDGTRTYTPIEFKNFNFSKFILQTHLLLMLNFPTNIPYHLSIMFKLYSPKIVIKKFFLNFYSMLFPKIKWHPKYNSPI